MSDTTSLQTRQINTFISKPETRRPSFPLNFLSNIGNSLRGAHHDDMLSNSPTIGNLAKFTDDVGANLGPQNGSLNHHHSGNPFSQNAHNDSSGAPVSSSNLGNNVVNSMLQYNIPGSISIPEEEISNKKKPEHKSNHTNNNDDLLGAEDNSEEDGKFSDPFDLSRRDTIIAQTMNSNTNNMPFPQRSHMENKSLSLAINEEEQFNRPSAGNHPISNDNVGNSPNSSASPTNILSQSSSRASSSSRDFAANVNNSTSGSSPELNDRTIISNIDPSGNLTIVEPETVEESTGIDKDGFYSVRLTPLIDHSSSSSGLYFSTIIRKTKPNHSITIGRYTEKNKAGAHAPQGSSAPIVFKSKVVSRTHALFECDGNGQWFLKDCKSSSGTFLNHIRLSPASQESTLMPIIDGDIIQLGMDYRGGTEEVYRCVKMRCEFNKSWQRKVNQFNLEIHKKIKSLQLNDHIDADSTPNVLPEELSECAICLMKIDPCQALFMSPCSHAWHYKCIRPIIIKSYPQFYCPNCRTMCDLETDIEDE